MSLVICSRKFEYFDEIVKYFSNAFECRMAVAILSLPNGVDFSEYQPLYKSNGVSANGQSPFVNFALDQAIANLSVKPMKLMHVDSNLNLEGYNTSNSNSITIPQQGKLL